MMNEWLPLWQRHLSTTQLQETPTIRSYITYCGKLEISSQRHLNQELVHYSTAH